MDNLRQQLRDSGYTGEFDLQSLIEACGDRFSNANRYASPTDLVEWEANSNRTGHGYFHGEGITPTEAVARLYLQLNKK